MAPLYIAINWTTRGNAAGLPTWQSVLLFAGMVVMAVLHCIESQKLSKAFGNHYYVFQQMLDNTTVLGGAVKVITDGNGHMLGLTSSIVTGLPES